MIYRNLGQAGLKVSEIAIGSWMTQLGDTKKAEVAAETIQLAYDRGVNFFDCADAYSAGEAEKFLGTVLKQFPREKLVISSKVFFPVGDGPNDRGLSRKHIFTEIENSLQNLQVDYLDMYFCHRFDPETPLEETLTALSDLVDQGKILYYGVSEWTPVQILKAELIIQTNHLHPISVVQPQYNMFDRYIEHELIDLCRDFGIGIVPFSPLSQGLLTGKYRLNQPIPAGSRATYQDQIQALLTDKNLTIVEELVAMAEELNVNLSVFALAWALRKPEISCLITGASNKQQLETNLQATELQIPDAMVHRIDKLFGFKKFNRRIG